MTFAAHKPVMEAEIVTALAPRDGGVYVDATFGGGGYTRAILSAANCTVYGFDRDPTAIEKAQDWISDFGDQIVLIRRPFAEIEAALAELSIFSVDGIVFDLGVSSMHLDEAERGFSFGKDGPLSMRMDGEKPDAGDVIASADAKALASIFRSYGEEKKAKKIAQAILRAREQSPIASTTQLADLICEIAPQHGSRIHPATRVFQALRIYVNDEIGQLIDGLYAAENVLASQGRLVVVTFHSLEDRIVKRFLVNRSNKGGGGSRHSPPEEQIEPSFSLLCAKPVLPSEEEIKSNPRSRSAKLRAGLRTSASPVDIEENLGSPRASHWTIDVERTQ